jgi:hypothetical protein
MRIAPRFHTFIKFLPESTDRIINDSRSRGYTKIAVFGAGPVLHPAVEKTRRAIRIAV